ncbi:hypothetical protein BC629DRAFT_1536692 [Irpex lacteus]|nr:hypothetical protein BC629DRAFT_1536692 [Irpex lacteus]
MKIDWTQPLEFVPKEVTAIYLPSWFVDTNASLHNKIAVSPDQTAALQVVIPQAFCPGHTMDPLCYMSMRSILERDLMPQAVPFSEDMRKQHNVDVVCMPYSLTPLSLVQAFIEYTDNKFRPSNYMMAAYPVLVPVYLAKYAIPFPFGTLETYAVIEAASKEGGAVFMKNVVHEFNQLFQMEDVQWAKELADNYPEFDVRPPSALNFLEVYEDHPQRLIEGLGTKFSTQTFDVLRRLWTRYADFEKTRRSGDRLDFDDLRIREWTQEETKKVQDHMSARALLQTILKMDFLMPGGVEKGAIEKIHAAVEETKPAWLKQWERQQASTNQTTGS